MSHILELYGAKIRIAQLHDLAVQMGEHEWSPEQQAQVTALEGRLEAIAATFPEHFDAWDELATDIETQLGI